jgi:DNA polymerase-3 subunit beta
MSAATVADTRVAFRAEAKAFADAVGWVARQLPAKVVAPVLAGVVLRVADGRLTVSGFDYEVATRATLDVVAETDGVALVSARLLAGVSSGFPNKPVDVAHDGNHLHVTCGAAKLRLPLMPVEDYPALPDQPAILGTVDAAAFVTAVDSVEFCAGRDASRANLTVVNVSFSGGVLKLTATNSYIAAIAAIPWSSPADGSANVPAAVLANAVKGFGHAGEVRVSLSAGLIGLSDANRSVTARLMDCPYPDMERLMPRRQDSPARVEIADLARALRQADKVREREAPARLTFTDATLTVSAGGTPEVPGYAEEIGCDASGYAGAGPVTVLVNPEYLLGGLAALATTAADMHLGDGPRKPSLLTAVGDDLPDYRFMFMPIRPGGAPAEPVKDATRASMRKRLEDQ